MPHVYGKRGSSGLRMGFLTLWLVPSSCSWSLMANRKLDSAVYHWGLHSFCPFFSTGMVDPLVKRQYQKDFLSIPLPIPWGSHLLWDCLDPLIIPFGWGLALLPYYWSLALMFLSIRNHYDKAGPNCAWEVRSCTSYAGNTVIVLVGNVTQVSGAMSYANSLGNDVIAMHVSTEETKVKDAEVAEEFKRYFIFALKMSWPSYRDIIQPTVEFVSQGLRRPRKKATPLPP